MFEVGEETRVIGGDRFIGDEKALVNFAFSFSMKSSTTTRSSSSLRENMLLIARNLAELAI